MKALIKRILALCGAFVLGVTTLQIPMEVQAAPSTKTVKNAYVTYLKEQISNCNYNENLDYYLYDFNKDGVKELVTFDKEKGRAGVDVYTYRNKKVVSLVKGETEVGYLKGKKYLVTHGSGGAYDFEYIVYKINKGKLVKVNKYACVRGVYKKDGKKFTKSKFNNFVKKVVTNLGTSQQIAKKYYTPKKLGISVLNPEKTYTCITKVTNSEVYYFTYRLGEEGIYTQKRSILQMQ